MLRRRDRPPADIVSRLDRDERVVSWAPTVDGGALVATRFGLWWPFADGPRRIGWHLIDKAIWRDGAVTVIEADLVDELLLVDRAPVTVEVDEPRDLPPAIRTRVEASVTESHLLSLDGGAAMVRVVGRRVPGRDGVTWCARLEPGTRDSPELRAELTDLLESRRLRDEALRRA